MNATARHLVRASEFHLIVDKDIRAAEYVSDFVDTCNEAIDSLTQNLALIAGLHQLDRQASTDFITDYIGAVSPTDTIGQSDLPALIKAALVANRKGA